MAEITLEQVIRMADQLSAQDQRSLAEHLADRLRESAAAQRQPRDLHGIWRGYFPDDFDIDAALNEIRHEWEKEWPQVFGQ